MASLAGNFGAGTGNLRDAILATEYAQFNATSLDGGIVDEAFLEWGVTRDIAGGAQLYGRSLRHDA